MGLKLSFLHKKSKPSKLPSSSTNLLTPSESSSSIASSSSLISTAVESTPHATCFYDASTLRRQYFAFPKTMIEYIAMNPASPKCYQKIIQACKYFFARNPIIVIPSLTNINCRDDWHDESSIISCRCEWPNHRDGWEICYVTDSEEAIKFYDLPLLLKRLSNNFKIWPTEVVSSGEKDPEAPSNALSTLIPRIYRSDAKLLYPVEPSLCLDELKFLGSKVEIFVCLWPVINAETGSILSFEEIIAVLPELKEIYISIRRERIFYPETIQKHVNTPSLKNYFERYLSQNPDAFDIEKFCDFMIKNKNIQYEIQFHPFIPQDLKDKIDACNTRLLNETYENGTKRPKILVNGLETVDG